MPRLELPEHGVELVIPPGALPDDADGEKQEIYIRVCCYCYTLYTQSFTVYVAMKLWLG